MININALKGKIVEKYGSQRAFCEHIGYNQNTLSRIMSGKKFPNVRESGLFAEALNLSADEFLKIFYPERHRNIT